MAPQLTCPKCQTVNPFGARFCLNCGASVVVATKTTASWDRSQWIGLSIAVATIVLIAWMMVLFDSPKLVSPTKTSDSKTLTPAQRAEAQSGKDKACNTVSRLQSAGAFTKVEAGYSGVTHAYVDRPFFSIPVDAKESALKAVALCYIDLEKKNQVGLVVIHDGYSGKRIGTFDFVSGLDLD